MPKRIQPHSQEDIKNLFIILLQSQESLQILVKWVFVNYQVSLFEVMLTEHN